MTSAPCPPWEKSPKKMYAWTIRRERFGEPSSAFQLEKIDVPEIGDDEVLVYVMAAGRQLQQRLGSAGHPGGRDLRPSEGRGDGRLPHRRLGCLRHRLQGRAKGPKRPRGRRGGHSLRHLGQPVPHGPSGRRSHVFAHLPHMGLRDELRKLRPVHPRSSPSRCCPSRNTCPGRKPRPTCS